MGRLNSNPTMAILRLVLYKGEAYRLPRAGRGIRVREGQAWVTSAGKDILVPVGEVLWFPSNKNGVIVSPVGRTPLVLEVLGENRLRPSLIKSPILTPATNEKSLS